WRTAPARPVVLVVLVPAAARTRLIVFVIVPAARAGPLARSPRCARLIDRVNEGFRYAGKRDLILRDFLWPDRRVLAHNREHDPDNEQQNAAQANEGHHIVLSGLLQIHANDQERRTDESEEEKRSLDDQIAIEPMALVPFAQ